MRLLKALHDSCQPTLLHMMRCRQVYLMSVLISLAKQDLSMATGFHFHTEKQSGNISFLVSLHCSCQAS
jgi:hypothetical protein